MLSSDAKNLAAKALQVYQSGDFLNAANLFNEAAATFQVENSPLDAAEMKNNQSVALLQAGDAHASLEAARGTAQIFLENGDSRRQGMAYGNEAAAQVVLGRLDEAIQNYRLAAEALQNVGEDVLFDTVMHGLAGAQLRKGKFVQAALSMRIGLAGLKHPTLKQKILRGLLRIGV